MDNELAIVFRLNDAVCRMVLIPTADVQSFAIALRDARGLWTWAGPGVERTADGSLVTSPARALAYAVQRASRRGETLVPWAELDTLNLQGATVADRPLTVELQEAGAD